MTKKQAQKVADPTPITGYRRKPRYAWREFAHPDLGPGEEPLKVRIQTNLSFEQIDGIDTGDDTSFDDAFAAIAPYIVEWNVLRENLETGQTEAVPPPAEAGPDVLSVLDMLDGYWLIVTVKNGYRGGDAQKKDSMPSASTPEPSADKSST